VSNRIRTKVDRGSNFPAGLGQIVTLFLLNPAATERVLAPTVRKRQEEQDGAPRGTPGVYHSVLNVNFGKSEVKIRIAAFGFLMMGATLVAGAGIVAAAPPEPPTRAHRHYITVNGEKVYVGPNFCAVPANVTGWAAYHTQVHLTDPGLTDVSAEGCPS